MSEFKVMNDELLSLCRNGTFDCFQNLGTLEDILFSKVISKQVADKCSSGRVRVGITALNPESDTFADGKALAVSHFFDADDISSALRASSYLSCFIGDTPYRLFRGMPVIDGGYKVDFPDICPPDSKCIRVSSYVVGSNVTNTPYPNFKCKKLGDNAVVTKSHASSSKIGMASSTLLQQCPYMYDVYQTPTKPMIHPGKYNKLRYTQEQWQELSVCVGEENDIQYMYELGIADAQAWFEQDYQRIDLHLPPPPPLGDASRKGHV
jgi:hypothetical protein